MGPFKPALQLAGGGGRKRERGEGVGERERSWARHSRRVCRRRGVTTSKVAVGSNYYNCLPWIVFLYYYFIFLKQCVCVCSECALMRACLRAVLHLFLKALFIILCVCVDPFSSSFLFHYSHFSRIWDSEHTSVQLILWHGSVGKLVGVCKLLCLCFEPSQPQRISSGLRTNFYLFPSSSFHK